MKRIRRSTTTTSSPPTTSFENLPRAALLEIGRRLSKKEISRVMCVSKSWHQHMIHNYLPAIAPTALDCYGLLLRVDNEIKNQTSSGLSMVFSELENDCPSCGSYPLLRRCSRFMQCKITSEMLLDCCNGLLLFCHRDGKADNLSNELYYYYVINPITKQCIAVPKPRPETARFMCAALAYDPSESSYFKIVQFQGTRQLNIFDAEKGDWANVKSKLPQEVTRAIWETKSVYNGGALYRLSDSGHVVKFLIDSQERVGDQAVAINLPDTHLPENKCTIGIRNKKIIFASIAEMSLLIWELKDGIDGGEDNDNWSLLHMVAYASFRSINCNGQVLAIHPYRELVLLMDQPYVYCSHYSNNEVTVKKYSTPIHGGATAFPILECTVPFACSLNKPNANSFQRLTFPKISRRRKHRHGPVLIIKASEYPRNYV